ncbi:hypothetical protein [Marinomonas atlantica]|uniref:hypothetical protein n=1 Tax=Marinomonas atlantica TaxID=1806668 RepID=UPI00082D8270|nr:hypothetical protein [Marinomonas atlantica]
MDVLKGVLSLFNGLSSDQLTIIGVVISAIGAVFSLIIAGLGIGLAIAQFRLKKSVKISSTWGHTSDWEYEDSFINEVMLKNEKDKAEAIYAIHLQLSDGSYLTLKEMNENPLILQPFETQKIEILPASFYSDGSLDHVDISDILERPGKKLVLSTSLGKHVTSNGIGVWSPRYEKLFSPNLSIFRAERQIIKKQDGSIKVIPRKTKYIMSFKQYGKIEVSTFSSGFQRIGLGDQSVLVDLKRTNSAEDFEKYLKNLQDLCSMGVERDSIKVTELSFKGSMFSGRNWFSDRKEYRSYSAILKRYCERGLYYFNRCIIRYNYIRHRNDFSFIELLVLKSYFLFSAIVLVTIIWDKVI